MTKIGEVKKVRNKRTGQDVYMKRMKPGGYGKWKIVKKPK